MCQSAAVSTFFTHSSHMPCPECGASVASGEQEAHACDRERLLDYRLFELREECEAFESEFGRYLETPHGIFAQWLAERRRVRPAR